MVTKLNATEGRDGLKYCAVVLALAMSGACSDVAPITGPGGLPNPAAPAPPNPADPAPAGSWVVRFVVVEDLPVSPDVRPAPGVPVRVFGGGRVVETISDANASFLVEVPDTAPFVRVVAAGPQYFTPCPAIRWAEDGRGEGPWQVDVVSGAVLSTTGAPNFSSGGGGLFIQGGVFEQTSAGQRPISGATVTLLGDAPLENPLAVNLTNARGFYEMCIPMRSDSYRVEVRKEGYASAVGPAVVGYYHETTDFVLTRR